MGTSCLFMLRTREAAIHPGKAVHTADVSGVMCAGLGGAVAARPAAEDVGAPGQGLLRDLEDEKSVVIRFVVGYRC